MNRRPEKLTQLVRRLALGLAFGVFGLPGCSNDGYAGKEFGQEFEKPADYPTKDTVPVEEDDEDPRGRRAEDEKGAG